MKTSSTGLAFVFAVAWGVCGCENYSTPYLDEQGRLNDRYKSGELSKGDYEQALERQREVPWGSTGDPKPPQSHMSF